MFSFAHSRHSEAIRPALRKQSRASCSTPGGYGASARRERRAMPALLRVDRGEAMLDHRRAMEAGTIDRPLRRSRRALVSSVVLLAALVCACRTTTSTLPPSPQQIAATHSVATAAWELRDGATVLGRVLRMDTVE